jgi:uncharacterized alkaline shock family protein YloU
MDMANAAPGTPASETVIAREVVAAIGAHAAAVTPGVIRLETSVGGLLTGLGRSARYRIAGITPAPVTGTSAAVSNGQASLQIEIAVSGDRQAAGTAAAVQRSVSRAVTAGTGLLVTGVRVVILDIALDGPKAGRQAPGPLAEQAFRADADAWRQAPAGASRAGDAGDLTESSGMPGHSRAEVCAAVLRAVRSVPGIQPASPLRPERARWMPWDPASLAVGLDGSCLEVQLAASRLPLPPLLDQAAAAIRQATARTPWGARPHRLVITALDASALAVPVAANP